MHSEPVVQDVPVAAESSADEDTPSLGIGALLALVLFLLAASAYAQDAEEPAGSPAPEIMETPATAPVDTGVSQNPLDPGTPPAADSESPAATEAAAQVDAQQTSPAPETTETTPSDAPPAPPVVENAPSTETAEGTAVAEAPKREKKYPPYQTHRPNFGLALSMTPVAGVAIAPFNSGDLGSYVRAFQFQAEYQPAFLQAIGVLGIGACGTLYQSFSPPAVTPAAGISWSAGGQIRYQFRYWREQYVVPTVSFGAEYGIYDLGGTDAGSMLLLYPAGGLMISLNWTEPDAAAEGYAASGVSRSYLWGEARYQMISGTLTGSGIVAAAGIRVEL